MQSIIVALFLSTSIATTSSACITGEPAKFRIAKRADMIVIGSVKKVEKLSLPEVTLPLERGVTTIQATYLQLEISPDQILKGKEPTAIIIKYPWDLALAPDMKIGQQFMFALNKNEAPDTEANFSIIAPGFCAEVYAFKEGHPMWTRLMRRFAK